MAIGIMYVTVTLQQISELSAQILLIWESVSD
jgi:hypothetical protein